MFGNKEKNVDFCRFALFCQNGILPASAHVSNESSFALQARLISMQRTRSGPRAEPIQQEPPVLTRRADPEDHGWWRRVCTTSGTKRCSREDGSLKNKPNSDILSPLSA